MLLAGMLRVFAAADSNVVFLWPFDESDYPHVTLTDAGPHAYDLTLMNARLEPGKFGTALATRAKHGHAVAFAGFAGDHPSSRQERVRDGEPSGLWGSTMVPERLVRVLADQDWTLEGWLKLADIPNGGSAVVLDLGDGILPGFMLRLDLADGQFAVANSYSGSQAVAPTDVSALLDGRWHHLAFTWRDAGDRQLLHHLDGRLQPDATVSRMDRQPLPVTILPDRRDRPWPGFSKTNSVAWRIEHRFNVALGASRQRELPLDCLLDEICLSAVAKYQENFPKPGSLTRNFSSDAQRPSEPNGPVSLFNSNRTNSLLWLGARRHLFIDDALCERTENLSLVCHPPTNRQPLNVEAEKSSWRPGVMQVGSRVYLYIPEGYNSEKGRVRLRVSDDGVHFRKPEVSDTGGVPLPEGDCVLVDTPLYGNFFEDLNPRVPPSERYKMTAWVANRGIYVFTSPDGIRWRRNESCMLPLLSGGDAETYWDDQLGQYVSFLKRDASFNTTEAPRGRGGRRGVRFTASEILKPWPFHKLTHPYFEGAPFPSVTGEGDLVIDADANGEVYRTRALKYPWAPDAHLAFVWRFSSGDQRRRIDLGVSRDGARWRFFADKTWYLEPAPGEEEVLSLYGLVRRTNELWQYFDFGGAHGGGQQPRRYARFTQRLDGFVSLSAGAALGSFTTHPMVFDGTRLTLNARVRGSLRVEVQDEAGKPLPGLALGDCEPVLGDSTSLKVQWRSNQSVRRGARVPVRLHVELREADLFALEFEP